MNLPKIVTIATLVALTIVASKEAAILHAEDSALINCKLRSGADSVKITGDDSRCVLAFKSKGGIGRAELTPTTGGWPKSVVIQIDIRGLEGFEIKSPEKRWEASLSTPSKEIPIKRLGPSSIEVHLPTDSLGMTVEKLNIQWIDFYR